MRPGIRPSSLKSSRTHRWGKIYVCTEKILSIIIKLGTLLCTCLEMYMCVCKYIPKLLMPPSCVVQLTHRREGMASRGTWVGLVGLCEPHEVQ